MITLTAVPPDRIRYEWRWIEPLLMRAMVKVGCERLDTMRVLRRLIEGKATAYEVTGEEASGVVILAQDGDCLRPEFASGKIDLPPALRMQFMRDLFRQFIALAGEMGCAEVRVFGRPAWVKVLLPLGFTLSELNGERVLRRKVAHAQ